VEISTKQQSSKLGLKAERYLSEVSSEEASTAIGYRTHLNNFSYFVRKNYHYADLDEIIDDFKVGKKDVYFTLADFKNSFGDGRLSSSTIRNRVTVVKNFLEYWDVDISNRKFKLKVRLKKSGKPIKQALDKRDIREILLACEEPRLKTYVMLLASTGMRAKEALSLRRKDLDLKSRPATAHLRSENTKTNQDRIVYLTSEVVKQIELWEEYKYRGRNVVYPHADNGKARVIKFKPTSNPDDMIFAVAQYKHKSTNKEQIYTYLNRSFRQILKRVGKYDLEVNKRRATLTFHSFRRFAKTAFSNAGYEAFGEEFIGHAGSTYYRNKTKEAVEIFGKIEPYLTFLDVTQLEARGADMQTLLEQERDKSTSLQEQILIMARAIAAPDEEGKRKELEKLARIGFLKTQKVD